MKNTTALKGLTIITAVVASIFLIVVVYWLVFPYKTIEFKAPYQTEKTTYVQGDHTYYTVNYCKFTTAKAGIVKEFVDGLVFTVDSPQAILPVGCREMQVPMTIPDSLPPGRYQLRNTVTYFVNPIRSISITHFSNWFTVRRSADGAYGDSTNNGNSPIEPLKN
jgi:hypothetical protein